MLIQEASQELKTYQEQLEQDPEKLLRQANKKFTKRFHGVEAHVSASGKAFEDHELSVLEEYWQHVKRAEKSD